jgi:hypothetical protein
LSGLLARSWHAIKCMSDIDKRVEQALAELTPSR